VVVLDAAGTMRLMTPMELFELLKNNRGGN
jgi:hypothetical protein